MGFSDWKIRNKVIIPSVVIMFACSIGLGGFINKSQKDMAAAEARETAKAIAAQIAADRRIYTENVVKKIKQDGIDVRAGDINELTKYGHIPLPATFVHLTSDLVNKKGFHTADLLSLWNINPKKKARNAQEEQALQQLTYSPYEMYGYVSGSGRNIRYVGVTADIASSQLCVDCHNAHPDSPRRDFRLNDVMGGLVVSVPLDKAYDLADRNALQLIGALVGMFGLTLFVISSIQMRFVTKPLEDLERAAEQISMGEIHQQIEATSKDEVGRLANAFERMRESLKQVMDG